MTAHLPSPLTPSVNVVTTERPLAWSAEETRLRTGKRLNTVEMSCRLQPSAQHHQNWGDCNWRHRETHSPNCVRRASSLRFLGDLRERAHLLHRGLICQLLSDTKNLQRVINTAQKIFGCLWRTWSALGVSLPLRDLVPSGIRCRCLKGRTARPSERWARWDLVMNARVNVCMVVCWDESLATTQ